MPIANEKHASPMKQCVSTSSNIYLEAYPKRNEMMSSTSQDGYHAENMSGMNGTVTQNINNNTDPSDYQSLEEAETNFS